MRQGVERPWDGGCLLLTLTLLVTCALTPSSAEPPSCFSQSYQDRTINVRVALSKRTTVLRSIRSPSERLCLKACCSDVICNMAIFKPGKQAIENCYLFQCKRDEDCPLVPAKGVKTTKIFKGLEIVKDVPPTTTTTTTTTKSPPVTTTTKATPHTTKKTRQTTKKKPTTTTTTTTKKPTTTTTTTTKKPTTTTTTPTTTTTKPTTTTTTTTKKPTTTTTTPTTTTTKPTITTTTPTTTTTKPTTTTTTPTTTTTKPTTTTTTPTTTTTSTTTPMTTTTLTTTTTMPTTSTATSLPDFLAASTTTTPIKLISKDQAASPHFGGGVFTDTSSPTSGSRFTTLGAVKGSLIAALALGLVCLIFVLAGKKVTDIFSHRQYTRLELNDLKYDM